MANNVRNDILLPRFMLGAFLFDEYQVTDLDGSIFSGVSASAFGSGTGLMVSLSEMLVLMKKCVVLHVDFIAG